MTDRDTAAVQRAMLEECDLEAIIRELWRRGFVLVPWEGEIEFVPERDDEALTA